MHAWVVASFVMSSFVAAAMDAPPFPAPRGGPPAYPAVPAEDLLAANDAEFVAGLDRMYERTRSAGAIPARYQELSGVTLSVVTRCEPCLAHHLRMAAKAGATGAEAIDALRLGMRTGGPVTIPTVRAGYRSLRELGLI